MYHINFFDLEDSLKLLLLNCYTDKKPASKVEKSFSH